MQEHVFARCGDHTLLFPAENVGFIEPVPAQTRLRPRRSHEGSAELVVDLRLLLGVASPQPIARCVLLQWRSTDGARQATLLLDAVDEIVNCHPDDLIEAPILPLRLRPFCEQVMHDPRGSLRLRVKPDVLLTMRCRADRRRLVASLFTREVPA